MVRFDWCKRVDLDSYEKMMSQVVHVGKFLHVHALAQLLREEDGWASLTQSCYR